MTDCPCPPWCGNTFPKNFKVTPGWVEYPNPGNVANLHRKVRDIMPVFYDGIEFTYRKGLAPNKTLISKWSMSHIYPSGFRIGGIYTHGCEGNIMRTPTIEADINPSTLSSNFSILYYPLRTLKFESKFQSYGVAKVFENYMALEYIRNSSTLTLSAFNANRDSGRAALSYLRSLTENFSVGCELLVEWLKPCYIAKTAFAMRYGTGNYSLAATMSRDALDISYWRQLHKTVQMGTSLVMHAKSRHAIASFCYQWEFKDCITRGMVDSDGSVGVTYQKVIRNVPCLVGFSLIFCIPSNRFALGVTMDLDPVLRCE